MEKQKGDTRTTVSFQAAGQPRPYADSSYRYTVTCEIVDYATFEWKPVGYGEDVMKSRAKEMGHRWSEKDDPNYCWASPQLQYARKKSEGVWEFSVTEAYTG